MQTHNTRELALNYRVNLDHNTNWLATKAGTKKMDSRRAAQKQESSFRELALNYRAKQERS